MNFPNVDLHERVLTADPDIAHLLQRAQADLDGGTFDDGYRIAQAIIRKHASGLPLRNILIEAEMSKIDVTPQKTNEPRNRMVLVAKPTELNIGLAVGFGLAPDSGSAPEVLRNIHSAIPSLAIGQTGIIATFEQVRDYDEMTPLEVDAFSRTAGFTVLPRLPLIRASIIQ